MNRDLVYKAAKAMCQADFPDDWERWWETDDDLQHQYVLRAEAAWKAFGLRAEMTAYPVPDSTSHRWVTAWEPGRPKFWVREENVRGTAEVVCRDQSAGTPLQQDRGPIDDCR